MIISLLILNTNCVLFYYSLYGINVTSLTENCCEKKVDNCNAHCYLDKKINHNANDSKGTTVEMKLKISEYIVVKHQLVIFTEKNSGYVIPDNILRTIKYSPEIEHPPRM